MRQKLWHKIPPWEFPKDEILLVDFGGVWPHGIEMVIWGSGMFWREDEGQWKGVGTTGTEGAKRWCRLDDAMRIIGGIKE